VVEVFDISRHREQATAAVCLVADRALGVSVVDPRGEGGLPAVLTEAPARAEISDEGLQLGLGLAGIAVKGAEVDVGVGGLQFEPAKLFTDESYNVVFASRRLPRTPSNRECGRGHSGRSGSRGRRPRS
jgi:hypothetical protein